MRVVQCQFQNNLWWLNSSIINIHNIIQVEHLYPYFIEKPKNTTNTPFKTNTPLLSPIGPKQKITLQANPEFPITKGPKGTNRSYRQTQQNQRGTGNQTGRQDTERDHPRPERTQQTGRPATKGKTTGAKAQEPQKRTSDRTVALQH